MRLKERPHGFLSWWKWQRAIRNLVTRTIRFQETFPSTCGQYRLSVDGRDRRETMQKVSNDEPETAPISLGALLPRPFRSLFRSNLERGLYDENGTQLYNMNRHVQAWQGGAFCGLKLEGAVRTSPLHVCISYALFPTCGCVQSATKSSEAGCERRVLSEFVSLSASSSRRVARNND